MVPYLDIKYAFHKYFYRSPVQVFKAFYFKTHDKYQTNLLIIYTDHQSYLNPSHRSLPLPISHHPNF